MVAPNRPSVRLANEQAKNKETETAVTWKRLKKGIVLAAGL